VEGIGGMENKRGSSKDPHIVGEKILPVRTGESIEASGGKG
jgi:hypothetical protein